VVDVTDATPLNLMIYGAGGHARVCVDVLAEVWPGRLVGAVTDDGTGRSDLGVPIYSANTYLDELAESGEIATFCVAIGTNGIRQDVTQKLTLRGHRVTSAVSPHAVLAPSVTVGSGVQVMPGAIVMAASRLGDGVIVNTNASIDHDAEIHDFVHVAPGSVIAGDVRIGARTLVGVGARVLPGISIGVDAVIGAGAVVVADVADGVTVVGVPARPLPGAKVER
jgi:UDP-perosamine 4-acetyltransferase